MDGGFHAWVVGQTQSVPRYCGLVLTVRHAAITAEVDVERYAPGSGGRRGV